MSSNLFEHLKEYGEGEAYPFHMPGHKRNPGSGPLAAFYRCDITEIDGFDNLHQPEGVLLEAQKRAAALYHSEETYFLINGSTSGILSAVSAVAGRGRKLLIARNCHKAVYHAAFLNRLEPEYIYPGLIPEWGLADGISAAEVKQKLQELSEKEQLPLGRLSEVICAIVLTSPTYDGILSDVTGIVRLMHDYGIPVIVDQAHGAHFGFHPAYPENAVSQGADLVIHSVHKTLPAPTQTALLHKNGTLVDGELLRTYLRIYQSSSPSYLLMAGIDSCMELVAREGRERLETLLKLRSDFIRRTKDLSCIRIYPAVTDAENRSIGTAAAREQNTVLKENRAPSDLSLQTMYLEWKSGQQEPGRLVLSIKENIMTGQQFYDILREKYQLQMEMCGENYVVAILTMMDRKEGFDRLAAALLEIDAKLAETAEALKAVKADNEKYQRPSKIQLLNSRQDGRGWQEKGVSLKDAFTAPSKELCLSQAEGEIAAEFINLYPPGIPLLVPGERIFADMIERIRRYLQNGYHVQGVRVSAEENEDTQIMIRCMIKQK